MDALMVVHVGGGAMMLGLGAAALMARKGSDRHRLSGQVFVAATVLMALPGGALSALAGKSFDVLSSLVAIYMVSTGWIAFRQPTRATGWSMVAGAALCVAGYLTVELYAAATGARATDAPTGAGYLFAGVLALAAVGDVRRMRGPLDRRRRTIRHVWRMNFGLFMATASFFGARPHLFPEWMQAYGVLGLLSVAPLLVMAYWRVGLRTRTG